LHACTVDLGGLCLHLKSLARLGGPERVGYLLGIVGRNVFKAVALVMARNVGGSPVEFEADPRDTLTAHYVAENLGLEVVGVFHTHPCGKPAPSQLDLRGMRLWPVPWVIATPSGLAAYLLEESGPAECRVLCGSPPAPSLHDGQGQGHAADGPG